MSWGFRNNKQDGSVGWRKHRHSGYEFEEKDGTTLRKELADLRQKWLKIRCSGQCLDFNCNKCENLREPYKKKIHDKNEQIIALENK